MKTEKVYAFLYNSCIHESSWATMSLHLSREGAQKALDLHKGQKMIEYEEYKKRSLEDDPEWPIGEFGEHESWEIAEYEILP